MYVFIIRKNLQWLNLYFHLNRYYDIKGSSKTFQTYIYKMNS